MKMCQTHWNQLRADISKYGLDHLIAPDPLADTPEGWYEFGQIIKWAHEKGWAFVLEIAAHHYCADGKQCSGLDG